MKNTRKKKAFGAYLVAAAAVIGIISIVRYLLWAPKHNAMDSLIVVVLAAGIILNIVLMFWDNDYLVIISSACFTAGVITLLADSVGSFVDAYQGIKMFGDSTQVGTIISIAVVMALSILLMIVAGFMRRVKEV